MSISLNQIGYSVAHSLGAPNDFFLREKIKLSAVGLRATLIRQDLTRNTLSKMFLQTVGPLKLICVDASDCPSVVPSGTRLLRTELKIPSPVRTKDNTTFYYVGTIDKLNGFQETTIDGLWMDSSNRFTSKSPKFYYLEGYIYVVNPPTEDLAWITVVSAFADPRELADYKCQGADCYSDDSPFPLEMDMWAQMEGLLLRTYATKPKDEEVRINTD